MPFFVPNKKVACTPLGKHRAVQMTGNTFKTVAQKSTLIQLSVVYGNDSYKEGDVVFIRGECMTLAWVREEYTVAGGEVFILVPEDRIELQVRGEMSDAAFEKYVQEQLEKEKDNV